MKPADFNAQVNDILERVEGPDVKLWEDEPDRRIKIRFKVNPGDEINRLMRANGWRFVGGPIQTWVRHRDKFSRASAELVLKEIGERCPDWRIEGLQAENEI